MDSNSGSLPPESLYARFGTAAAPIVVDVRRGPAFDAGGTMIAGALRRPPEEIERWRSEVADGRAVVVYCVHGHEVSRNAATALRAAGIDAIFLEGGITAWTERGLPTRRKAEATRTRWVTRARPKIDRIACPWLVRRFVDPEAEFLYVPADRVAGTAREAGAVPFDVPGVAPFAHDGERCSFDGFVAHYEIRDPALDRLAAIVRGADTGKPGLTPQSPGLLAVSLGLSAIHGEDDHGMLAQGMHLYDALYAWCRSARDGTQDRNTAQA